MPARENGPGDPARPVHLFHRFIATGAFSGYLPWAPGTAGSLVGVLCYLIPGASGPPVLGMMIVSGFFIGRVAAFRVADSVGHRLSSSARAAKSLFQPGGSAHPDPSIVVIDEIVGMWISLLFLPKTLPAVLIAFTTFRVFDIVKPPPAAGLEKIGLGWGIMLDDVAAGMYACVVTHITLSLIG
jgi:phosphatidylglycerophosphatase A